MNDIILILVGALLTLLSLCIGYFLGSKGQHAPEMVEKQTRKVVEHVLYGRQDVGAVNVPSAEELEVLNDPRLKAEHEAMAKTFDDLNARRAQ